MKPTRFTNEAELKALFDHAVRAIGFYEAQRKEALVALESLRRVLKKALQKTADAVTGVRTQAAPAAPGRLSF